jgi:hypothetical protein
MTEQNFDINNLRIASPCSVAWETMKGDARKRSCEQCKLSVYNFSEMTAEEVRRLVVNAEGRICGRFYRRTDGTVLTKDCPVGFRAYQKRVARFAGAALTAILGLFSVSFGQKTDEKPVDNSPVKIVRAISLENILSGTVVDAAGAVIPNADITLRSGKIIVGRALSDEDGKFSFSDLKADKYSLEVVAPGFETVTVNELELSAAEKSEINLNIQLNVEALMGDIITVTEPLVTQEMIENLPVKKKTKKPH